MGIKFPAIGLLAAALAWPGTGLAVGSGALDDQTFVGEIGGPGKAAGDPDELIFRRGTFRSTACDRFGFGEGAYHATHQGDVIMFDAETQSPTDGKMAWEGRVQGDRLEGAARWTKPGQAPVEYWVKGTLKKSP